MLHPTIKNTLWLLLLTTYTLATFQYSLLEVGHWLSHIGETAGHHHFHNHDDNHKHQGLKYLANIFDTSDDKELPHSQRDLNLKQPQLVATTILPKPPIEIYTSTLFNTISYFPKIVFIALETPPPDSQNYIG